MFVPTGRSVAPVAKTNCTLAYIDNGQDQENELLCMKPPRTRSRKPLAQMDCNQTPVTVTSSLSLKQEKKTDQKDVCSAGKRTSLAPESSPRTGYVSRRNERERNRVKLLNMGFERLRAVVPSRSGEQLSKISTLRKAIWYIEHLDRVLHGQDKVYLDESAVNTSSSGLRKKKLHETETSTDSTRASRTIQLGGQGVATGLASWSGPESTAKPNTGVGVRPVKQKPLSPIFPPRWGNNNGLSETTSSSTPRTLDRLTKIPQFELPCTNHDRSQQESGYASLSTTSRFLTPVTTSAMSPRQHLLASLESFNSLFPYYTDMLNQPSSEVLNLTQLQTHWSHRKT
ncbi:hypothetical protein CRM22_007189 [Opisthorchis felineus]|uniref:BHLH domain-containing protein n=1 Tax=Opisthorchis felineus TaxID=147828 RepID=A0A4S2LHS5_OPIFE|nr:hypothetical protein CRM22_007189 [Opisthorchis felineus]